MKTPGDITILHKCAKNHDYMLYCSWDMTCDTCNCCFSFWAIFWPFTPPLTAQKIKISKKMKKLLEISSFYRSVPKIMIICCTVLEIWHLTHVIVVFHFGPFLTFYPPPLTTQKIKIKKKKKKIFWRFHHFTHVHVYHKLWLDDVQFLRYGAGQMEGQTDRQLSRGGCST